MFTKQHHNATHCEPLNISKAICINAKKRSAKVKDELAAEQLNGHFILKKQFPK